MKRAVSVEALDEWDVAGRRLRELSPARFERLLQIARTYLAAYDRPDESDEIFASRLAQILGRSKASA
jgi:hypothetical protein